MHIKDAHFLVYMLAQKDATSPIQTNYLILLIFFERKRNGNNMFCFIEWPSKIFFSMEMLKFWILGLRFEPIFMNILCLCSRVSIAFVFIHFIYHEVIVQFLVSQVTSFGHILNYCKRFIKTLNGIFSKEFYAFIWYTFGPKICALVTLKCTGIVSHAEKTAIISIFFMAFPIFEILMPWYLGQKLMLIQYQGKESMNIMCVLSNLLTPFPFAGHK